jgi:CubicO group peptidase (beta-lactamase class C family)
VKHAVRVTFYISNCHCQIAKTEVSGLARHVPFPLRSRYRQPALACLFGATRRHAHLVADGMHERYMHAKSEVEVMASMMVWDRLKGSPAKSIRASCMAALTLCLASVALADDLQTVSDPESLGFSARRLERMTSWFSAQSEKGDPSGFVVAIARSGKLVYLQPTGFEDHDKKIPMRPDSIFRIGSMSKQITSVATMMLVDEGKLDLDAPVAQYLPELKDMPVVKKDPATGDPILLDPAQKVFEPAKRAMTIRDLLRNTSGLVYGMGDYADPGFGNAAVHLLYGVKAPLRRDKPLADFAASLGALPLLHQPGEVWEYSIGYDVLGRVIEVVSGQTFDRFLQSRLFAPLHMVDSGFSVPADKLARLVAVPGAQPAPLSDGDVAKPQTFFSGGGGIVSTAPDLLRFCQMLLNGGELDGVRILKPETVRLMTTNSLPPDIPRSEQSGVPDAPARGRVRRARDYLAVAKEDLLAEFLPHWG